jgi:hypothetical protein
MWYVHFWDWKRVSAGISTPSGGAPRSRVLLPRRHRGTGAT